MKSNDRSTRLIAFYLPQFHPVPENDAWWGKGFTEWTNVTKARPLFRGHYQPRLPADLGYYDLRVPEVREAQAELARNNGIEGFCYYHYWFAGKRILERPFQEVVSSGKPDFPFCLCWANQTWTGIWHGAPGRVLVEQTYPGAQDNREHFMAVCSAFLDSRYLQIDSRPIFVIYKPLEFLEVSRFIKQWQELAIEIGLPGLHFIAHLEYHETDWDFRSRGFSSCVVAGTHKVFRLPIRELLRNTSYNGTHTGMRSCDGRFTSSKEVLSNWVWRQYRSSFGMFANVRLYQHARRFLIDACKQGPGIFPCVVPNWDNTPRSNIRGLVLHESTPELFRAHLRDALDLVRKQDFEHRLVFVKAWNEWAEGNYLEPDRKFGHDYLSVMREEICCSAGEKYNEDIRLA